MNRHSILSGGAFAAAVAAMTWTAASKADTTVVESPPSGTATVATAPVAEREAYTVVTTAAVDKPTVHVTPTSVGTGYGLAAFGSF